MTLRLANGLNGTLGSAFSAGTAICSALVGTGTLTATQTTLLNGTIYDFAVNEATNAAALSFTGTNDASGAAVLYVYFPTTLPSVACTLVEVRSASAVAARFSITASNKFQIQNAAGTSLLTYTNAFAVNTWYRLEMNVTPGTTTTNGTINAAFYLAHGTAAQDAGVYSSGATVNAGTANVTEYRGGKVTSGVALTANFALFGADNGNANFIGPAPLLYKQDFESGTNAAGGSVTTGSGGGGNTGIAAGGTAPIVTTTGGEVISGNRSAKCVAAAGAASYVNMPVTLGTDIGIHFDYTIDSAQFGSTFDEQLHTDRTTSTIMSVTLRGADKKISFTDSSGAYITPSAITAAGTYTFDIAMSTGTTATAPYDGKNKVQVTKTSDGSFAAGMTAPVERTARNNGTGASWANVNVGAISTTNTPARAPIIDTIYVGNTYAFVSPPVAGVSVNTVPVVTAGAVVSINSGTTTNITASANDSDGTISSFACSLASTTSTTNPTIGTGVVTGAGTANATVTFPISNLSPGDHFFAITATDNSGGVSASVMDEVIFSALAPTRRSVTINGVTQTLPASGTAVAALNNQANVPVSFTTAGPPAAGAGVIEVYQPLDPANVAPYYGQWWAASDTNTPITVYVDLKFNGVTKSTATATLTGTTPVFVGKTVSTSENTAIGSTATSRVLPSVESRFS